MILLSFSTPRPGYKDIANRNDEDDNDNDDDDVIPGDHISNY